MLYFVTGNAGKFREIRNVISDIEQLKLELDEIQNLDPQIVIAHKLDQAAKSDNGNLQGAGFIVEDTSLCLNALGGFPGTFIKWMENAMGLGGIGELASKYGDTSAIARAVIGYQNPAGERHYVTGEIKGTIVMPRHAGGIGWDDIFVPEGYTETFSQLGSETKSQMSMRHRAVIQLKQLLDSESPVA